MNKITFKLKKGKFSSGAPLVPNLRPKGVDLEKLKKELEQFSIGLPEGTTYYVDFKLGNPFELSNLRVPLASRILNFLQLQKGSGNGETIGTIAEDDLLELVKQGSSMKKISDKNLLKSASGVCKSMGIQVK